MFESLAGEKLWFVGFLEEFFTPDATRQKQEHRNRGKKAYGGGRPLFHNQDLLNRPKSMTRWADSRGSTGLGLLHKRL